MLASIILVTRNRASHLKPTLQALQRVHVPAGLEAELLVVDNGSTDETAEVVSSTQGGNLPIRLTYESKGVQTVGRNRGIAETTGDYLIFTDDDVRPPVDWLTGMCEPLLQGRSDAVSGGVSIAPHLVRPWMRSIHRCWLASSEWLDEGAVGGDGSEPCSMVGANMAFSREVLRRVPQFDPELGPGGTGFCDDHLFAMQLLAAGYRIANRTDVKMEHHFDPARLQRDSWLSAAERRGTSHAYLGHHWEHWGCKLGDLRRLRQSAKLAAWRACNPEQMGSEGCCEEELRLVFQEALVQAHVKASKLPRNYPRHGLAKLFNHSTTNC